MICTYSTSGTYLSTEYPEFNPMESDGHVYKSPSVSVATEQKNLAFMIFSGPNDRLSHQIYVRLKH